MKYGHVIDARRDGKRRHIWLCADDYGMSPAVNVAIRDLVVRGRINATSVMVVAPNFYRSEAVSLNILNASETRVAIGLHVTLTAPYQPLSRNFQPVCDGIFLSKRETARHSFLHLLQREMLESEISSQLQEFITAFGRLPDFVDGHQHVHLFPQIREALLSVVKNVAPNVWVRQCGRIGPLHKRVADGKANCARYVEQRLPPPRQPVRRARQSGLRWDVRLCEGCRTPAARPTHHLARARIPLSDRQLISQPARRPWPHAAASAVDKLLIYDRSGRLSYGN
jgi:predicted glycoside hydrolase/deacetylase ChbG (UPF0249 family)